VVRTEQVATQAYVRTYVTDAVANAQATLSEWVQGQIDGLEASKVHCCHRIFCCDNWFYKTRPRVVAPPAPNL